MTQIFGSYTEEEKWYVLLQDDDSYKMHFEGRHPGCPCIEFESEQAILDAYPALVASRAEEEIYYTKLRIDAASDVRIDKAHLAKAKEAEMIKFDNITTPPERFPHLDPEARSKGLTMEALADIVWEKHVEDAQRDNQRIVDKGAVS